MTTGFGGSNPLVEGIKRWIPGTLYELLEIAYNARAFLRLRAAVHTHRPDVIYERFSLFLFAGIWVRRRYGVPVLLEVNSPLYEERAENDGLRLRWLGRWAQSKIWNRVDQVLPVTNVLARTVAEYGVAPQRITVIPNGVNLERFRAVPDSDASKVALNLPPRIVLGFVGFIRGWNAVNRLIDFVALHHAQLDLHILVVGDGPARDSLFEHAGAQGVADRLTITGIVERDDVARHIGAIDIAVLPGITPYSSPLKLFEYLQLGRAIVAPDTENIREILTNEEDALLFDPTREGALEAALWRLCADTALRTRLGKSAPHTIIAKSLTWDRNAERILTIAETVITDAPKRHRSGNAVTPRQSDNLRGDDN
jgi:glycosyltransferase involved in cell wall biosynthesis